MSPVGLEELALAYLREPGAGALPGPARSRALPLETGHPSEVTGRLSTWCGRWAGAVMMVPAGPAVATLPRGHVLFPGDENLCLAHHVSGPILPATPCARQALGGH